jgi:serine/threonine protein kinase
MFNKQGSECKLGVGFQHLNNDFIMPDDFVKLKKLGKGVYGSVMAIAHKPTGREYACKRFEHVFIDDQRARRLIRETQILKSLEHPCCNSLKCVLPPHKTVRPAQAEYTKDLQYQEVYLVLKKCDMDLAKLLKSSKHLEET